MRMVGKGAVRTRPQSSRIRVRACGQPLIAGMAGMMEGLAAHIVARQKTRDHARIAFLPALEQRQRAIAMTEEAQHRRHAVTGVAQRMRRLDVQRRQARPSPSRDGDRPAAGFRRTVDMAAIGQDLPFDLVFQPRQTCCQPPRDNRPGRRRTAPAPRQLPAAASHRALRRKCAPAFGIVRASETNSRERHIMSELCDHQPAVAKIVISRRAITCGDQAGSE